MDINYSVLKNDEKAVFKMRSLYQKYGYSQFKMSKFEEYDLYVRNKDFLVSENIITFTDTNGKLMALKPDVTLSIIKNSEDSAKAVSKVYYNENVYRVSKGTESFKEIMQVGLECIGDIDTYNIYEVIMLACESLKGISEDFVLDISNMDIVSSMIDALSDDAKLKREIIKCISEKNIHGIGEICERNGIDEQGVNMLKRLVSVYGDATDVLDEIKDILDGKCKKELNQLSDVINLLINSGYKDNIRIDFSVISDANYYNGFVFKGFIKGISSWILSGGQYDKLMERMKKTSGAIGFAVYLDLLERFNIEPIEYDVDAVILYDDDTDIFALNESVKVLTSNGKSVMAVKETSPKIKYKQLLKQNGRGVEIIENNA